MTTSPERDSRIVRTTERLRDADIGKRLRVGFITHLDQTDDLNEIYDLNIKLAQGLEKLGYDSVWIATRHFNSGWAALPSPFAFYGAVAQATSRINLGTAVLPIVVDDPLRVAEEVAVLDHISKGRVQFGLGKGVPSNAYHLFSKWGENRDESFLEKIQELKTAISGEPYPGSDTVIWPPSPDLAGRIYHGTSNWDTIVQTAEYGDGFLIERFGAGDERTPANRSSFQRRQANSVLHYRSEFERAWGEERTPYVVVSRSAWPGPSEEEALAEAAATTAHWNEYARILGRLQEGLSPADELLSDNVPWGTPEQLAADLIADDTLLWSDEVVLGIHPGRVDLETTLEKARILIEEVYPLVQEAWLAERANLPQRIAEFREQRAAGAIANPVPFRKG